MTQILFSSNKIFLKSTFLNEKETMTVPNDSKVTMTTLLQEMIDREAMARISTPSYQCKQASSWDRTQTEVGGENWYANKDYERIGICF